MKKIYLVFVAVTFLAGTTLFNSCKKDEGDSTDTATLNQEQSSDEQDVSATTNETDDDINTIMSNTSLKSTTVTNLPCNVTIDSSLIANKKMTITFHGDNCKGTRTRTGSIETTLTNGSHWKDAGAVLTVKFNNLVITRKSTGKSITLNGTKTYTNITGGLVKNIGFEGTPSIITHTIASSDMKFTFPNGSERNWNIARIRTYTKVNNYLVVTTSGFGEAGGHTNLVTWGTNRRGVEFYTEINTPVVESEACDYNPSSGVKIHYLSARTVTVTYGVDMNGNAVTEGCADYYKASWDVVNGTKTVIMPY
jgi:hypothetical protein